MQLTFPSCFIPSVQGALEVFQRFPGTALADTLKRLEINVPSEVNRIMMTVTETWVKIDVTGQRMTISNYIINKQFFFRKNVKKNYPMVNNSSVCESKFIFTCTKVGKRLL